MANTASSFLQRILGGVLDRDRDGDIDRDDAIQFALGRLRGAVQLPPEREVEKKVVETTAAMVSAAGLMREASKGSIFEMIFGNNDLIRGLVATIASRLIKAHTGITIPPGELNDLIERLLDKFKGRKRKDKEEKPGRPTPTPTPTPKPEPPIEPPLHPPLAPGYLPHHSFGGNTPSDKQIVSLGYVAGRDCVYVLDDEHFAPAAAPPKWGMAQADDLTFVGFKFHHRLTAG